MGKAKLSAQQIKKAADSLRLISHPTRLRIIQILAESERSVGELAELCGIAHNLASTHLKLLERSGLLGNMRCGKSVCYRIADCHLLDLLKCIEKRFK